MNSSEIRDCVRMNWRIHGANMVSRGAHGCFNPSGEQEMCMYRSRILEEHPEGYTYAAP
jgi:hypothetical protein